MRALRLLLPCLLLAVAARPATLPGGALDDAAWRAEIAAWKADRDQKLRRSDGWLTLVGLAWLKEGTNSIGSDPASAVRLPAGRAPLQLGRIELAGTAARFVAAPGERVTVGGQPVENALLLDDHAEGGPTIVERPPLLFHLIRRDGRLAVRIKDRESANLSRFHGLEYFPLDPAWRLVGRFEALEPPGELEVPNALGFVEKYPAPGHVVFSLGGVEHRLVALDDTGDGRLFVVFGDRTNGKETYGGGRFLYVDPPQDGRVVVDFNRAYSPPCVFTPYATCPLPPKGNKLPLRVAAGELVWSGAPGHP